MPLVNTVRSNTLVGRIQGEDSIINNYSDGYIERFFKEKDIRTTDAALDWAYNVQLEFVRGRRQYTDTLIMNAEGSVAELYEKLSELNQTEKQLKKEILNLFH